jgi:CheY-like chemotaxis protein
VRVVIADDQTLVRGGFRLILKAAGIEVVAESADGEQAVAAVLEHLPDVVLMDIRMPELDGIEATRRILAAGPAVANVRIIILTTFDLDQYVYAALAAGAPAASCSRTLRRSTWSPPSNSCRPGTRCSPRRSLGAWSSASRQVPDPPPPPHRDRPGCRAGTCPP